MMHLIWGIANIAVTVSFVVICFKATRLVRASLGFAAASLFAIGLFSFIGRAAQTGDKPGSSNQSDVRMIGFVSKDSLFNEQWRQIDVVLDENIISKNILAISVGKDIRTCNPVPVSAFSNISGFVNGFKWRTELIIVNPTADSHRFEYEVSGTEEWQLLTIPLYSEHKSYTGLIELD